MTSLYATTYDRSQVTVGIAHIGFGAFHRAHQAVYIDDFMQKTGDLNWGIAAINLLRDDSTNFAQATSGEDGYVLKTTTPRAEKSFRKVRAHVAFADWAQDSDAAVSILADQNLRAVSITVTESGYHLQSDWALDLDDPLIRDEVAGQTAQSIYAFVTQGLLARLSHGSAPVTILCCDNMRENGHISENALKSYIHACGH